MEEYFSGGFNNRRGGSMGGGQNMRGRNNFNGKSRNLICWLQFD